MVRIMLAPIARLIEPDAVAEVTAVPLTVIVALACVRVAVTVKEVVVFATLAV